MERKFSGSVSEKGARISLFLFFGLLAFSAAFFVFAEDTLSGKNIFEDSDQDGLSNEEEGLYRTDPFDKDTDGDGYSDGVEVESGYDPKKRAPGDKIIVSRKENESVRTAGAAGQDGGENMTEQVSQEIASILRNADGSEDVSLDQVNESVQKVLSGAVEEVKLPEVDMKEIKVKKAPKGKNRDEREREDALEYLTVMAYLLANNSPKAFQTQDDLSGLLSSLSEDSISALAGGNMQYIDQLAEKGEKILEETKAIEVPEAMLDTHVKALKMAKYAAQLKGELKPNQDDPLGQIATLSKAQGFIGAALSFSEEIQGKLSELGIEQIPLEL